MNREKIEIITDYIKLDSFLKLCGACGTGGEAKMLIQDGNVMVDGCVCVMRGKKLVPGAVVSISGSEYEVIRGEG